MANQGYLGEVLHGNEKNSEGGGHPRDGPAGALWPRRVGELVG